MMTDSSSRILAAGEGETLWFAGAHQTIKYPGEWSDGKFSLVEVTVPRGRATPLHRDPSDETFYVLDGEFLFHIDGTEHTSGRGRHPGRQTRRPPRVHRHIRHRAVPRPQHPRHPRPVLPRRWRTRDQRELRHRTPAQLREDRSIEPQTRHRDARPTTVRDPRNHVTGREHQRRSEQPAQATFPNSMSFSVGRQRPVAGADSVGGG